MCDNLVILSHTHTHTLRLRRSYSMPTYSFLLAAGGNFRAENILWLFIWIEISLWELFCVNSAMRCDVKEEKISFWLSDIISSDGSSTKVLLFFFSSFFSFVRCTAEIFWLSSRFFFEKDAKGVNILFYFDDHVTRILYFFSFLSVI